MVDITFTAEVTYVGRENKGQCPVSLKVDDGSQYGGRAQVWTSVPLDKGDMVTVTTSRMPYGKTRTYTDRDGREQTATDIIYPEAEVEPSDGYKVATEDDEEVAF